MVRTTPWLVQPEGGWWVSWQTAESLRIYKRFQPATVCSLLDRAQHAVVESYTAANMPTISSYEIAAGINAWNG